MLASPIRGDTQQERLESFYASQAELYDAYRYRMLHGRLPMAQAMPQGGTWVDMGGGTASNLEFFGEDGLGRAFDRVVVLDLTPSLCEEARKRIERRGWGDFASVVCGDACAQDLDGMPPAGSVDLVTFSYSLSMIPGWRAALDNAMRMLKPGGHIAVCDFTTFADQASWHASFWTAFFANDHVHLNPEHHEELRTRFDAKTFETGYGSFPYLLWPRSAYYYYVGQKRAEPL